MTKLQTVIDTSKFQINHYGDRINGTHVNFHLEGKEHDIILPLFNLKFFQIEQALENLTPYELDECLFPNSEHIKALESWEADLMIQEELLS